MKLINIHTGEIVDTKDIIKADWFKKVEDNYCIYDYKE